MAPAQAMIPGWGVPVPEVLRRAQDDTVFFGVILSEQRERRIPMLWLPRRPSFRAGWCP